MIEYCDVINKVKKDSFLVHFYEKHKDAIIFKKRYDELMDTYRAIFRLSGDLILTKDKAERKVNLYSDYSSFNSPYRQLSSCFLPTIHPDINDSLSKRYSILKKEKLPPDVWTLKQKEGFEFAEFTFENKFITIKMYQSLFKTKIIEDDIIKKHITKEKELTSIYGPSVECMFYNLENLEEVLNRLVELEG